VRLGIGLLALAVALAAALGVGLVVSGGGGDGGGRPTPGPPSAGSAAPELHVQSPPAAAPVLSGVSGSPAVSVGGLRRHLRDALTAPGLGRHLAFSVAQLDRPSVHWWYGRPSATPASTLKLLTTTAALATLGPEHRFTTTVLPGPLGTIVLVGGGDPLLTARTPADPSYPAPATLAALASDTAAALLSRGIDHVRLGYDSSRFTGPAVNPHWPKTYVPENVVSPISPLWVDEGRRDPGLAARSANPALAATEAFRRQLTQLGVRVSGPLTRVSPRHAAQPLASVESAPLVQIVQHILELSDNEGAEVLLRQVAVAQGRPGSFIAGVRAVRDVLTRLGLDLSGARFYDGSGLSRQDVLPTALLLHVLELDASATHPQLRGVVTGLPVAGFSGSLGDRFDRAAAPGRGLVHAKTGTLSGVSGLAGFAVTRDGQALVFVALADRVPLPKTLDARADLDTIAAALATCGC
jgi:D-alanyl-D-alanine carboxypeptidase/D-alanyl-D-alanine-endopeptidase (penicillin-binding protein 4)